MKIMVDPSLDINVGFGHFKRCHAIANELASLSNKVDFIIRDPKFDWLVNREKFQIHRSFRNRGKYEMMVVDRYDVDEVLLNSYKKLSDILVRVDDGSPRVMADRISDVIINGNPYAKKEMYEGRVRKDCLLIVGSNFIPMDRDFCNLRKMYRIRNRIKTALITFGGSAVGVQYANRICRTLVDSDLGFNIIILNADELQDSFATLKKVKLLPFTDKIGKILIKADVAISSSSSTCWQLASIGIPFVALQIADNQLKVFEYIQQTKIGITLEPISSGNGELVEVLSNLNLCRRKHYWSHSRNLIDCRGAIRLATELVKIM